MANRRRLSPNQLAKLRTDFAGLKGISGYAPVNNEFKIGEIQPISDAIDDLQEQEAQLLAQVEDLRDQIADKGKEFTQKIKGAAQQIIAQFGDDSTELQAMGRKRSSERAARKPKAPQ